jgi:hypothetical protein
MKIGQEFNLKISINESENVYAFTSIIQYDPKKIEALADNSGNVAIEDGGFFSKDGKPTTFLAALKDGKKGQIVISCNRLGDVGGVSDDGIVSSIRFIAKAEGDTSIKLIEKETHLLDPSMKDMEFDLENINFTINLHTVATIKLEIGS